MKFTYLILFLLFFISAQAQIAQPWAKALEQLTPEEKNIVERKGTERPFSGKYVNTDSHGVYRCKVCNSPLYRSDDKFQSHCGWPSFDDAIAGAIKQQKDADGMRMEIVCAKCGAHLGHLFEGEGYTSKNKRYCVNSLSLNFDANKSSYKHAYFSGGCFWGVEYYLEKLKGVIEVNSGFMGGSVENPSYQEVVGSKTGHLETVEVLYDPALISYEDLAKTFFEIHDPTQKNGQGPDIGDQYQSAVFVSDDNERDTIEKLIALLRSKGYDVATKIMQQKSFYRAEEYHQDYYRRNKKEPYCHARIKRF